MIAQVVGHRNVSFTDKKGEAVSYDELHCVGNDESVRGNKVFTVNEKLTVGHDVQIGKFYKFEYEPTASGKARLVSLSLVDEKQR